MSSAGDADARGPTGTFAQPADPNASGTVAQAGPPADGPTRTFQPSDPGPAPTVASRNDLTVLIVRCREGLAEPILHGFQLVRELGSGSYGTVWEALNRDTGERVAVKFFLNSRRETGTVLEEVTNLRDAEGCYGIISVKQVNRHGTPPHHVPNYVMSLEAGGSLQKKIDAGPLLPEEAVRLFTQLCRAMAFVHTRGLLHCDLKPANILLNAAGEPVVADFGQAQRATGTAAALGTFFYMAPEQATRQVRPPSTQADVYALGAILYTMLTGKPPRYDEALLAKLRTSGDVDETLETYREGLGRVPPPTAHRGVTDPLLAKLIDRCLSLDPAKRPTDAGDLLRHLKHREWWGRTRPVVFIGTVATAVALLLMVGLSLAAADFVLKRSKADITREIQGSLLRDAWFGRQESEAKIHERIEFLEDSAFGCPRELRDHLAALAKKVADEKFRSAALTEADRRPIDLWLRERHNDLILREARGGWKAVGVILVSGGRGFYLSRIRSDRSLDDRSVSVVRELYATDWSFRDYFNGTGNDYPGRGRPHEPIRTTHISQAYRSTAETRPWLIDLATPIFANPTYGNRQPVVALLVSGFDLNRDLRPCIEAPPETFPAEMTIANQVKSVLVNDRGCWVWHEGGMATLAADPDHPRDPERYLQDADDGPRFPTADGAGDPITRGVSAAHADPLAADRRAYIAAYEPVRPYANSRYDAAKAKEWHLVVKLDAATALRPADELKQKMQWAGLVLFAGLLAITVILWAWLIRLLRRQEFATHG